MNTSLSTIVQWVDGTLFGDEHIEILSLCGLDDIKPGSLVFAENKVSLKRAENSDAAVILLDENTTTTLKPYIQTAQPFKAFIQLIHRFYPAKTVKPGIHPTAVIAPDAILGDQVNIGPYVTIGQGCIIGNHSVIKSHVAIGEQVTIGAHTTIHPHVTIYDHSQIGEEVTIHAGTVVGSDGFGYKYVDGHHMKFPHLGKVVIHNQVEIGALTAIDRASFGETVIGEGTKIDNLVQIAHAVKLGKQNILCAFTGIAGSTTTGDRVICAANVGVSDHVRIEDDVILGARTGVAPRKQLTKGNVYYGTPARTREKAAETELSINRIPMMRKNMRALSERVKELTKQVQKLESDA